MSDIKFYNPNPANYVSNYVPMPVDTILDSLQNEQGIYDKTFEDQKEYDKIVSDVLPGYLTQDVYRQYKQDYAPEFLQDLTEKVISGQDNIRNLKKEIRKKRTQITNDFRINAMKVDRAYSDMVDKHRLEKPNSEVYPMTQLTMDQIKAGVVPNAGDYRIAADYNVYDKSFKEITTLIPDIVENIKINPSQGITTNEKVKELRTERLETYFSNIFNRFQESGEMDNIYIKSLGANYKDPVLRKEVFDKVFTPLRVHAYKQIENDIKIQDVKNQTKNSDGTPKPSTQNFTPTTSVNIATGAMNGYDGKPMTSTQDLNSSIKTTNKNLTTQKEVLSNLLGLNYDNSSFLKSLEITPSGIITNPEIIPNEYRESLGANNVRDALSNIKALENQSENYKLLENSIKEELGTLKINPEKINDAFETVKKKRNAPGQKILRAYKDIFSLNYNKDITEADFKEISEYYDTEMSKLLTGDDKKAYEFWRNYNNKKATTTVVSLPSADKGVKDSIVTLINGLTTKSVTGKDFLTDKEMTDLDTIEDLIPKNEDTGAYLYDQIGLSYALDPKDGLVGVISTGKKLIEVPLESFNIDELVENVDPESLPKVRLLHQAAKSLKNSNGQKGQMTFGNTTVDFKFNVVANKYEYMEELADGTKLKQTTNDIFDIINYGIEKFEKSDISNAKADLDKVYKTRISSATNDAQRTYLTNEYNNKLKILEGLGKQNSQRQEGPLGN
jgi:DNA-binding transcriptional regulator YhcF (GntR family)